MDLHSGEELLVKSLNFSLCGVCCREAADNDFVSEVTNIVLYKVGVVLDFASCTFLGFLGVLFCIISGDAFFECLAKVGKELVWYVLGWGVVVIVGCTLFG